MKWFGLNLDEIFEDDALFHEFERIQDGKAAHRICMQDTGLIKAAEKLAGKLVPFLMANMFPVMNEYARTAEELQEEAEEQNDVEFAYGTQAEF